MRALHEASIIAAVLTLGLSGQAMAGGKGGGGGGGHQSSDTPKENIGLNYGKIEKTYKPQKDDGTLPSAKKTGSGSKVQSNEFTIKKTSDKASPK